MNCRVGNSSAWRWRARWPWLPPLVLMDEPFSNLDAAMRVETRQEVRKLLKQTGAAGHYRDP